MRDGDAVDESRNHLIGILEGGTDEVEALNEDTGSLVGVVRDAIELAGNGLRAYSRRRGRTVFADQFVIHRSRAFFIDVIDTEEGSCEGGGFAERDEDCFVDLSFRVDERSAEQ